MGWSWAELSATPVDVVRALVAKLNEQAREASQGAAAPQTVTRPRRR